MLNHDKSVRQWLVGIAVLLVIAFPLVYSAIVVPLSPAQQAQVSLAMIGLAALASLSRAMRPFIIFLSCFASMRYFYWRISSTINLDSRLDASVSILLLSAEVYGLLILFLGYFQTIEAPHRVPQASKSTPAVDIFVPTYNESVDIVRRTIIGALAINYPRKTVYVLDDGRRSEIEDLARNQGAFYITRPNNVHAKAGNLNHALGLTEGELIAVFDADHVPVRSFLTKTVGFFEDPRVALVQTAQHFFNPDPFERNLNLTNRVAPEQDFFYHVVQPGNDWWNSAFFCGSCAVLRRSALLAIGGFRTETVTEDAHTSLELHSRGYRSVYLPQRLAAGLATETFASHVKQRMRWARGMVQILRLDCPLFKKGLSVPQRLNYFNAMFHFFFGIPRLIMILAPLSYLLLGAHPIKADALSVIAYILPHVGLSMIANSIISKNFRHSFWAAVYEVSIAPYTVGVTLLAVVNPRLGKFQVTDKGTRLDEARYDFENGRATLILLGLSLAALMVAFPVRLVLYNLHDLDPSVLDSILINSAWALANLLTLIAAASVALEQPQQRKAPRVRRGFPCELVFENERVACRTLDLSEIGVKLLLERPRAIPARVCLSISSNFGVEVRAQAVRKRCDRNRAGQIEAAFAFEGLDASSHQNLVQLLFTGEESWTERTYPRDGIWRSFWYLLATLWRVTEPRKPLRRQTPRVRGRWRARYGKAECECFSVSATGALVRYAADSSNLPRRARFDLEMSPGLLARIEGASRRVAENRPGLFVLDFDWSDFVSLRAFADSVYEQDQARVSRSVETRDRVQPLKQESN